MQCRIQAAGVEEKGFFQSNTGRATYRSTRRVERRTWADDASRARTSTHFLSIDAVRKRNCILKERIRCFRRHVTAQASNMNAAATCAFLLLAAVLVSSEFIGQVAVGPLSQNIEEGGSCRFSMECQSKCCSKVFPRGDQAGSPRQCRRFAEIGEPCSDEQIKGGIYVNGCPCRVGYCDRDGYCKQE